MKPSLATAWSQPRPSSDHSLRYCSEVNEKLTFAELSQVLNSKMFEQLIGEAESEYLDAKEQPYRFTGAGNHAKRELAKDITSFANANGGFIIIGFSTDADPIHPVEQITGIKPIPRALINVDQHYKLINEWIFPQPAGVTITLHEHALTETTCLGSSPFRHRTRRPNPS